MLGVRWSSCKRRLSIWLVFFVSDRICPPWRYESTSPIWKDTDYSGSTRAKRIRLAEFASIPVCPVPPVLALQVISYFHLYGKALNDDCRGLKVIAITADGASANTKTHKQAFGEADGVVSMWIARRNDLISNVPHLIKTVRNYWSNYSFGHNHIRKMKVCISSAWMVHWLIISEWMSQQLLALTLHYNHLHPYTNWNVSLCVHKVFFRTSFYTTFFWDRSMGRAFHETLREHHHHQVDGQRPESGLSEGTP